MGDPGVTETSDEYYRELLARVDDAIVETRGNYYDGIGSDEFSLNHVQSYCMKACSSLYQGLLVLVAVIAELCMTVYEKIKQFYESQSQQGSHQRYSSAHDARTTTSVGNASTLDSNQYEL
uniref:Uncharacterized protein n=1 Tax=Aplanochytrium stocchinoi TaxID=215587 RepID=A0A7S3PH50_9STRA|mmetsp:Transcript_14085/g.16103  ORF Transcript_14085/g.16103 Transcript_14085/m.16103 type:complete len:121 (+) Transcript_14085:490-852(+)